MERPLAVPLTVHEDLRGFLYEMWRADHSLLPQVCQVYCSAIYPGVVKGWHRHRRQWDYVTCVYGTIYVAVWREDDPDGEQWVLGPRVPRAVVIPPGWWHGWKNLGTETALIVNCVSEPYDAAHPDEERCDPHAVHGDIWVRRDR